MKPPHQWLRPHVEGARAEHLLERWMTPRWSRMWGWVVRQCPGRTPHHRRPQRLELVFLPCAWLDLEASGTAARTTAWLVNGYAGNTECFATDQLQEFEPHGIQSTFPFPLSEPEALEAASSHLLALQLNRIVPSRSIGEKQFRWQRIVQYPYWVRYVADSRGMVNFDLLDAITGKRGGTLVRTGFLRALHREKLSGCAGAGAGNPAI